MEEDGRSATAGLMKCAIHYRGFGCSVFVRSGRGVCIFPNRILVLSPVPDLCDHALALSGLRLHARIACAPAS